MVRKTGSTMKKRTKSEVLQYLKHSIAKGDVIIHRAKTRSGGRVTVYVAKVE